MSHEQIIDLGTLPPTGSTPSEPPTVPFRETVDHYLDKFDKPLVRRVGLTLIAVGTLGIGGVVVHSLTKGTPDNHTITKDKTREQPDDGLPPGEAPGSSMQVNPPRDINTVPCDFFRQAPNTAKWISLKRFPSSCPQPRSK